MACLAAVVFGAVSYSNLPLNLMPDLDYPTITVRTEYPGAAPAEVESYVSEEIEESLSTVPGLASIESVSRAGLSDVILEFEWDTDMSEVSQAVRERLGLVDLIEEAKRPLVLRYDPNLDPIVRLALAAEDDSIESLVAARRLAEDEIRPALERLPGVAAVKVRGGLEREVTVEVHEGLLHARGFTLQEVIARLAEENINLAGGSLLEGQTEYLIRTLNEFRGPDEISDLYLVNSQGTFARLGDLAEVSVRPKDREVVGRVGGREAVEVAIYREADANIVSVSRAVRDRTFGTAAQQAWVVADKKKTEEAEAEAAAGGDAKGGKAKADKGGKKGKKKGKKKRRKKQRAGVPSGGGGGGGEMTKRQMTAYLTYELPEGMEFQVVSDQARFIEAAISDVAGVALGGAFLAVLVLFIFLRHGWSTFIIATAIPVSVVVTFAPMYLFGVSLNLMSLGGLALAIGMLVDNSIVVLESIHRCREEGDDPVAAAIRGASEVSGAVTASTLTTVAVFLPIAFVSGVAGQLFGHLALTVVFGLLASLAVALFLIPVLAALPARVDLSGADDRWAIITFKQPFVELRDGIKWIWSSKLKGLLLTVPLAPLVLLRFVITAPILWGLWLGLRGWWLGIRIASIVLGFARRLLGAGGGPIALLFDAGFAAVERGYERLLRGGIRVPFAVLVPAALLFVGSLSLVPRLGSELLPEVHQSVVLAHLVLPVGTPLERTMEATDKIALEARTLERVDSVYAAAGTERAVGASSDAGENTADLVIRLTPTDDPAAAEEIVKEGMRGLVAQIAGAEVVLSAPTLFSFKTPLEVDVRGERLADLRIAADTVVIELGELAGLRDVRSNLKAGYPEIQVRYDRKRLEQYGLDIGVAARAVRDKVAGRVATDLRGQGRRTDVRVVLRQADRSTIEDLESINVNPRGIPPIPLKAVADLSLTEGPSEIRHSEGERAALVTANVAGFDLGTMAARVDRELAGLNLEGDVRYDVGGQSREMDASLESLRFALLLAIFLVYVIMASQFESVLQPAVILFALPLALVGAVVGLLGASLPVSVVVLIGAIVLAGVVVNNAIVLVDYANQLRDRGQAATEAIVNAGRVRLRPIIISTLTTVLGLMPMAIGTGEGSEIRQPLALTVIAGLLSSTLLTLVIIPVLYSLLARLRRQPAPAEA
ncbi:MAG: efflux RND transporter permease subunit [Proteobacteria bacterium]|nr:efflux RND transporter permease subunit [Pseudomonadota bacterium]